MIFRTTMTPSLRLAIPKCRDDGTPDLLVLPVRVGSSDIDADDRFYVGHLDDSPLSADEAALVRVLLGGARERVS